jgi:hypothetical protein
MVEAFTIMTTGATNGQVSLKIKWFANQNDSYFIPETQVWHKHKHNQLALNNGFPVWPIFPQLGLLHTLTYTSKLQWGAVKNETEEVYFCNTNLYQKII